MLESCINSGPPCCRRAFGVIPTSWGHRIRDQGVGGSNPLSPTNFADFRCDSRENYS